MCIWNISTSFLFEGGWYNWLNWTSTRGRIFSQARNELVPSKARGIRDNHYEARSLLVPSSFPARLKIRPQATFLSWPGRDKKRVAEWFGLRNTDLKHKVPSRCMQRCDYISNWNHYFVANSRDLRYSL